MENTSHTSPDFAGITLEKILESSNLNAALKKVESNKGAPGVDGMKTDELRQYIIDHPGELRRVLLDGTYRPKPVKRVTIPKSEPGKFRELGIPTVIDRLVQQAVLQVLNLYYDTTFSTSSYGFRPFRDCKDAVLHCIRQTDEGKVWAVDVDLEKFFDTVNHSRLIRKLSTRIKDPRVISLIHRMLKSGIDTGNGVVASTVGLMQGGPLSPLLANIYLDELDKELEKRGHSFARYADDLIVLCNSKRAAERTLRSLTKLLEGRMLLKVNQAKSGVSYITYGVKFLGFGFYWNTKIKRIVPSVHRKSKVSFVNEVREVLSRNRKGSIEHIKKELREKLVGWNAYFKWASYDTWLKPTDQWIRRRIRQLLWKCWKKVRTRYKALRKLGCPHETALMWANSRKAYWHIANSQILATTLTNDFLKSKGWTWLALSYRPFEWK